MILRFLFCLLFISSCNVIESITGGDTEIDEAFFNQENSEPSLSIFHGLVSFYRFDEVNGLGNFSDVLGQNNLVVENGTALTDVAIKSTGMFGGGAVNCSGYGFNSALAKNSTQGLNFGTTTDFTIAFWIRRTGQAPGSGLGMIFFDNYSNFYIQDNVGDDSIGGVLPGTTPDFLIPTNLGSGSFDHVVMRVDRDFGYSICLNGSCPGFTAGPSNTNSIGSTNFRLCAENGAAPSFEGDLDSLGIWNRLLSDSEVSALNIGVTGLDF